MFTCEKEGNGAVFFWTGFAVGALAGAALTMLILSEKGKVFEERIEERIKDLKEKTLHRKEEEDSDVSQDASPDDAAK